MADITVKFDEREFVLGDGIHVIGRGDDADLQLEINSLSRLHARFTVENDSLYIEDLGSKNGTFVNGRKIDSRVEYTRGDTIKLGDVVCEVVNPKQAVPSAAPIKTAAGGAAPAKTRARKGKDAGLIDMAKKVGMIAALLLIVFIVYKNLPEPASLIQAREIIAAAETLLDDIDNTSDDKEKLYNWQADLADAKKELMIVDPAHQEEALKAKELIGEIDSLSVELEKRFALLQRQADALRDYQNVKDQIAAGALAPEEAIMRLEGLKAAYQDLNVLTGIDEIIVEQQNSIIKRYKEILKQGQSLAQAEAAQGRYQKAIEQLEKALETEFPQELAADVKRIKGLVIEYRQTGTREFDELAERLIAKAETGDCTALKKELKAAYALSGLPENQNRLNSAVAAIDQAMQSRLARARAKIQAELARAEKLYKSRAWHEARSVYTQLYDKTSEEELRRELRQKELISGLLAGVLDTVITWINREGGIVVEDIGEMKNLSRRGYQSVVENNAMELNWTSLRNPELIAIFAIVDEELKDGAIAAACGILLIDDGLEQGAELWFKKALQRDPSLQETYAFIFDSFLEAVAARKAEAAAAREAAIAAREEARQKRYEAQSARPSAWVNVGYGGGGAMYRPRFSPVNPNLMWITSDMQGVFLSKDQGDTWRMINQMRYGQGVEFHPTDENILFCGTNGKLYRSEDGGDTFRAVTSDRQYPKCTVWDVLTDPDAPDNVWISYGHGGIEPHMGPLAGSTCEVGRSTNAGANFSGTGKGLPKTGVVQRMALDLNSPTSKRRIYAATSQGFFISIDGGDKWQEAGEGLKHKNLRGVATLCDRKTRRTVVLASLVDGGIYRSEDGGVTFSEANQGIPNGPGSAPQGLCSTWVDPNIAYVGVGSEVYKTEDAGKSWKATGCQSPATKSWYHVIFNWGSTSRGVGVCKTDPNLVAVTSDMYATKSTDGGQTWHDMACHPKGNGLWWGGGLEVTYCYRVIANPNLQGRFYGLYADIGSNRTSDNGQSWAYNYSKWNSGIRSEWRNSTYGIAVDPDNPKKWFAAISGFHNLPGCEIARTQHFVGGIVKTSSEGMSYTECSAGLPDVPATDVIIDNRFGKGSRKLICSMIAEGVYYSENEGGSWSKMSNGLPNGALTWRLAQSLRGDLYLACVKGRPGGLWKYDWAAKKWNKLDTVGGVEYAQSIYVGKEKQDVDLVYLAASGRNGGLYRSRDAGATWEKIFSQGVWGFDRTADGTSMWVAGRGPGVQRSIDNGKSWEKIYGIPFPGGAVGVTVDPFDNETIWVATPGGGIFRGPAGGVPDEKTDIK